MISEEETRHVAHLARLGLSDAEIKKLQKDLSSILDYIEKLKKADVSEIELYSDMSEVKNVSRQDLPETVDREKSGKLRALMPQEKNSYLKVKKVL